MAMGWRLAALVVVLAVTWGSEHSVSGERTTRGPKYEEEDAIVSFNANHIKSKETRPLLNPKDAKADMAVVQEATQKSERAGRKKLLLETQYIQREEQRKITASKLKDRRQQERSAKFEVHLRRDDEAHQKKNREMTFKDSQKLKKYEEESHKQARSEIDRIEDREERKKQQLLKQHRAWKQHAKKKERDIKAKEKRLSEAEKKEKLEEKEKRRLRKLGKHAAARAERKKEIIAKRKQEQGWKRERRAKQRQAADFKAQMAKAKHSHELNVKRSLRAHQERLTKFKRTVERDSKSEASQKRAKHSFVGMCALHNSYRCPAGWTFKGLVGLILSKNTYDRNPFRSGGNFNSGWRWSHPYLCCANNPRAIVAGMYMLSRTCGKGSVQKGLYGMILLNRHYHLNPFTRGGGYNNGWTWTHPYACWTANDGVALRAGACLLARSCPTDRGWHSRGLGGILMYRGHYRLNPFSAGGAISSAWRWTHPYICCRS